MNSIVFTHFPAPEGASLIDIALARLSAWLDAELDSLEALLALTHPGAAVADIAALRGLHLDADATPRDVGLLLAEAETPLTRLLERVCAIRADAPLAGPAPADFHAWVNWTGARLEDIIKTLRRAPAG